MHALVSLRQKFSGRRFRDIRISWLIRSTCVKGLKLMGRSTMTSKMLTRANMIEMVPDRFELSTMSSFVFSKVSAMPSTMLSRPF